MDCLEGLKLLSDNCIDSIVTDPPYELGFMGKRWDSTGIAYNVELWKECLRVLKPGGHLLSFGGTRTYHKMAFAIEDAGFEIRDQIMWVFGSGFPKSVDISKAIDKKFGAERRIIGRKRRNAGSKSNHAFESSRELEYDITEPATNEAKQWSGWGTALKPSHEPIVVARKPLSEKTVADNVLKWGTGGINIDECRIPTKEKLSSDRHIQANRTYPSGYKDANRTEYNQNENGRFPANIILDEEAAKMLDKQSGITKSAKVRQIKESYVGESNTGFLRGISSPNNQYDDVGGASRFFYCAKASKKERGEGNNHPTVKPLKLMEYLIKLVTPPNGIVLDPFAGSGTTLLAAKNLGFNYIGFEKEDEYIKIINKRLG